jgi:hypothetical protein
MNIKSTYQSIYNNGVRPPYYEPTAVDAAFFIAVTGQFSLVRQGC